MQDMLDMALSVKESSLFENKWKQCTKQEVEHKHMLSPKMVLTITGATFAAV